MTFLRFAEITKRMFKGNAEFSSPDGSSKDNPDKRVLALLSLLNRLGVPRDELNQYIHEEYDDSEVWVEESGHIRGWIKVSRFLLAVEHLFISSHKAAYICGPLTELPEHMKGPTKTLYGRLADVCELETGRRAFVPHEHYDPQMHASFTPQEVDAAERYQVCNLTTVLIVVALEPTWGGGIEVEMANHSNVPAIILKPQKNISRLLRGNPAIKALSPFRDDDEACSQLRDTMRILCLSSANTRVA